MRATGVDTLALQSVDTLSGGQRQRVDSNGAGAETSIMLLDEPTTWLDISYQIDLLELLSALNREQGYTLAAVLHDLNQACRYATHLIALRDGKIVAQGAPKEIVTAELIEAVYGLRCMIIEDPVAGTPLVVPLGRRSLCPGWRLRIRATTVAPVSDSATGDIFLPQLPQHRANRFKRLRGNDIHVGAILTINLQLTTHGDQACCGSIPGVSVRSATNSVALPSNFALCAVVSRRTASP
jgi:hypothetical protein